MKQLFVLLLVFPIIGFSQETLEQELDSISTAEEAKTFAKAHKKANKSKLFTFNKEKHKTRLADDLFKLVKGGKQVVKTDYKKTYYKVIDKNKVTHYRVSYIYFDGSKMTLEEINDKRNKILGQYSDGYKFDALAKLHSMDLNAKRGGDLGWFPEGQMHPEFEDAVKQHNTNDIFTLDIADKNWSYIVLKTFDAKPIEEITVLKYTEAVE
ncbi:peptidylprolyl isomerase [Winogradskyella luteola]|uniref:peptidylprolyl isomerase n=1 Tax=Winogradskyella luteola TaxID=2828330 RepID=A0A9X1F6D8_9FLAO|nr:peptidylprolyl isomerase [Winogradskyella luteola]MBV7268232.1 peptidylprolyl isomerase [Winogradskyella luteola]